MPVRFLLDENLRGTALWPAIGHYNALNPNPIETTRVGDLADLPLGTPDPEILLWCERTGRILLSLDKGTMPVHLAQHIQAGHHCPGIFIIRSRVPTKVV